MRMAQLTQSIVLIFIQVLLVGSSGFGGDSQAPRRTDLYVVPNFHPGCMGWLVRYSEERNYCLYSYLAHLDRVA
ncbi:MAG: hypothetical protein ACYS76_05715, partial [Planctomycetota bacterium]